MFEKYRLQVNRRSGTHEVGARANFLYQDPGFVLCVHETQTNPQLRLQIVLCETTIGWMIFLENFYTLVDGPHDSAEALVMYGEGEEPEKFARDLYAQIKRENGDWGEVTPTTTTTTT